MDLIPRKIFSSRPRWKALFWNPESGRRSSQYSVPKQEQPTRPLYTHPDAGLSERFQPTIYVDDTTQTSPCLSYSKEEAPDLEHGANFSQTASAQAIKKESAPAYEDLRVSTASGGDLVPHTHCPNHSESGLLEQQHEPGYPMEVRSPEDPGSEDARRALAYIFFVNEEEEDYTSGPVRIVTASDGVKDDASALLLSLDLSAKVRRAVLAQRAFQAFESASEQQKGNLWNLELDIGTEIDASEFRLGKAAAQDAEHEKAAQQLSNMRLLLENVHLRQQKLDAQIRTQMDVLRTCQTNAISAMEEAFVIAGLVSEAVEEQEAGEEPYDLQTEYQQFMRDLEADSDNDSQPGSSRSVIALDLAGPNFMQSAPPPLSPEAQQRLNAKEAFYDARQKLLEAQMRFDRKEEDQARARHQEKDAEDSEETETFDLHWLQRNREITRELIEAEEQLADAKAQALALGVEIRLEDQASGFSVGEEEEEEGNPVMRESWEGEATAAHFSRTNVDNWLGTVDEKFSSELVEDADADDWHAQEVEISESRSLVAWGPPRRKIDKWQQVCRERR
ncbi:hypothetical protein CERZMDRAFT_82836 [Cercospora zeae-maydis SCOH1-5]|uniref:Uncharacterized protein n=1 Tax=Cercospora zeae-maydis SCOH1-5 TaxID=717836 RepID=A0A6A6FNH5_9PEZI|nr:hypothetical protein CERZMDRAFT_82836 [Cercospora zeae-maydis SCOH1-5]